MFKLNFHILTLDILAGETRHLDSQGHSGIMRPGCVQWMTAGSGVVHDERPTEEFSKTGGVVEGSCVEMMIITFSLLPFILSII